MVDMPGYGFATGNQREVESWKTMIETYLLERETLCGAVLIMDIRRKWSPDEEMLKAWFDHNDTPWMIVLNKSDKLSRSQMLKAKKDMEKASGGALIFTVSSMKKTGLEDIKNVLFKEWPK